MAIESVLNSRENKYADKTGTIFRTRKPQKPDNQLFAVLTSDSEAIRTLDPRLRRALLYPAELRNHP